MKMNNNALAKKITSRILRMGNPGAKKGCRLTILLAIVATASMPLLGVADGGTNMLSHMTTRQKVDYAKQLSSARCLGAAFDALCEAVEDLLPKETTSAPVIHLDARPVNPMKGQATLPPRSQE